MKPDERNIDEILEHSLPTAPRGQMDAALDRVFARLQSDRGWTVAEPRADVDVVPVVRWSWRPAVTIAVATVAVAAAVWLGASLRVTGDDAVLEIAGGSSSRIGAGQIVEAIGDGSMLALPDGSRVEMRAQSELAWARADDGLTIRLRTGSIIVNAAKQRSGHLYVQTKDMTVAVVGTVFLVNAEKDGSRVAVIEGEVRVQEGTI
jgi:ferric-dicitrate binding protein FerR (iron transport regulator)